jgi:RNA polymerase-binding transcription factor DksA
MDEREFELAEKYIESANAAALALVRQSLEPESHPDFDHKHCIDCGVCMPVQRLLAGRIRCTDCQALLEQMRRRQLA